MCSLGARPSPGSLWGPCTCKQQQMGSLLFYILLCPLSSLQPGKCPWSSRTASLLQVELMSNLSSICSLCALFACDVIPVGPGTWTLSTGVGAHLSPHQDSSCCSERHSCGQDNGSRWLGCLRGLHSPAFFPGTCKSWAQGTGRAEGGA